MKKFWIRRAMELCESLVNQELEDRKLLLTDRWEAMYIKGKLRALLGEKV